MKNLTKLEKDMHIKLCEKGIINWTETSNQQTQALNRLIKKGYVIYDGEKKCWLPV